MLRNKLEKLKKWSKSSNRKPLLIRGARQVGKTYLIEKFGKDNFKGNFLKLDFEANPQLRIIFANSLEPKELIPQLELHFNDNIQDGETLLFFDEVQACPEALMSLRYFYEQRLNLHIVAAGSLLEFVLDKISFPVGRVEFMTVSPLTFDEFLLANNKKKLLEIIKNKPQLLKASEHQLLLKEYELFSLIGGLPESVKTFINTNSILESRKVQNDLLLAYEADFSKYSQQTNPTCLRQVFSALPQKIGKTIKYSQLNEDFSQPTVKKSFELLTKAQVINKIPNVNPHGLPLGASASEKFFKAIYLDVSFIHAFSKLDLNSIYIPSEFIDFYKGNIAEQLAGQELYTQTESDLYSWNRDTKGSTAEVDYVFSQNSYIYGIEVKAGTSMNLKSLHQFNKDYKLNRFSFVISKKEFSVDTKNKIIFLPNYYTCNLIQSLEEELFSIE